MVAVVVAGEAAPVARRATAGPDACLIEDERAGISFPAHHLQAYVMADVFAIAHKQVY